MELPVIQDQDAQALGESVCQAIEEILKPVAVEIEPFEEEPLSSFWLDDSIQAVTLVGRPLLLDRFYAEKGNPAPCERSILTPKRDRSRPACSTGPARRA